MQCPRCFHEAGPGAVCQRCGAPSAIHAASPRRVPLTFGQRARLLVESLPLLTFALVFAFAAAFADDITGAPAPPKLLVFLGFVLLVVGSRRSTGCAT